MGVIVRTGLGMMWARVEVKIGKVTCRIRTITSEYHVIQGTNVNLKVHMLSLLTTMDRDQLESFVVNRLSTKSRGSS